MSRVALTLIVALASAACVPCRLDDWTGGIEPTEPGEWRQFRLEPTHRGLAPEGTWVGPELELTWKSEAYAIGTYSASKSSPIVDEDTVYIGVDDGRLRALDKQTGELRWTFETRQVEVEEDRDGSENRGIHGTAAVDEDTVYVGDYSGRLYALDKATGELLWDNDLGGSIGASPVLYLDHIFIDVEYGMPNGRMFVVHPDNGRVCFKTPYMGDHPHGSTTIDDVRGTMSAGANNGLLATYDIGERELLWDYQMDGGDDGDIKSTAAVDGDTLYITSWDQQLHAIDVDSGARRFTFEASGKSMSSPSVLDGVVYFGSHDGRLYAVDADPDLDVADDQERELWRYLAGGGIISSPTVVPETGVVLIGSGNKKVHMLDLDTGEPLWTFELDGGLTSVPVATGGSLYLNDTTGTVWRFDMPD